MKIGIIGSGNMGGGLGMLWAKAGHEILFSHSRNPEKLRNLVADAGPKAGAGSPEQAAEFGQVIMLAVAPPALGEISRWASLLAGKTVITCVSAIKPDFSGQTMGLPTELTVSVAEQIAASAPKANVVEAFNLTFAEILASPSRAFDVDRPTIPFCGDDPAAKATAATLIEDAGFAPMDVGPLIKARTLETLASAWVQFAVGSGLFPDTGLKILRR